MIARLVLFALLAFASFSARAQLDYSAYGTLDASYGRFENSGFDHRYRVNSNSLSASFVGLQASYGFDGGWKPGINVETFLRFQDLTYGRNDSDKVISRNAFLSLQSDYGLVRVGRLQSYLFETTTRFNAFGNSTGFSPVLRQLFLSGNLDSVQGDFYWDRAASYSLPKIETSQGNVQASVMYALGKGRQRGDYAGGTVVYTRGLLSASLSGQRVHVNDGIADPTDETTVQFGAAYNFGWAKLFGQYTHLNDRGLDSRTHLSSAGVTVPLGPGSVLAQMAYATSRGPAVERRHTTTSLGYVWNYETGLDFYLLGSDDRVRNQTRGLSYALGARYVF